MKNAKQFTRTSQYGKYKVFFPCMEHFNKPTLFSDFLLREIQHQDKKLHRSTEVAIPKVVFSSVYFSHLLA